MRSESLADRLGATYRGKRVLVTGHTGFKGGWLCSLLHELGAVVSGLALPPEPGPNLFDLAGVGKFVESRIGDLRDPQATALAVEQADPEIVFHLAAQPLVLRSYREPVETFASNIMGTLNLLQALRGISRLQAIVVVTSDKVYENVEQVWAYREPDALGGKDPYSASKACAEIVTASYRESFFRGRGVGVATARAGNVIGGGDFAENRLLPDIVRGAQSGTSVALRRPNALRPWQHVLDPLAGYLLLGKQLLAAPGDFSEAWNFGPRDDGYSVFEVATLFAKLLGRGQVTALAEPGQAPHEAELLRVDASKAQARLGIGATLSLRQSVALTADWYRAHFEAADLREMTTKQLRDYTSTRQT